MIEHRCILALWLLSLTAVANARLTPAADASTTSTAVTSLQQLSSTTGRQLQQNAFCPDGCLDSASCVQDATMGGLRCQKCKNNLRVSMINGMCSCPAGRYADASSPDRCLDCPLNSYCPGGTYRYADPPDKIDCPPNMVTLTMRTGSIRACVNRPGWYVSFDVNNVPYVTPCPVDTYSPGNRRQRQCTPCPTGFTTDGLTMQRNVSACIIPAGFYLKAPGQVAPCPKGEYKEGTGGTGNCTKCPFGVTTLKEASTSVNDCAYVVASYYPTTFDAATGIVTATKVCPQGYFCPGGKPAQSFNPLVPVALAPSEPTIKRCPSGMWTVELGSVDENQCLTPPGHFTANGVTAQCPNGTFRADWKPAGQAASCTPCGDNVFADKSDVVVVYDINTYAARQLAITTAAEDCYIKAGQGLMFQSTTGRWRAVNCDDNNYGVTEKTYGLGVQSCKKCPLGLVASKDKVNYPNSASHYQDNGDGTGGFIDVKACVTQDGYGATGRGGQPCDAGKYNKKDEYDDCTACPFGMTTAGPGLGVTLADCGIALGYGFHNGAVVPCPIGTYNPETYSASKTQPCTACPVGSTTMGMGGDALSSCSMCAPGYGGATCGSRCGGPNNPTYGPTGREYGSPCTECLVAETGFSFEYAFNNDMYAPRTVAPLGADSPQDCLAEFGQILDGSWWLPTTGNTGMTRTNNVLSWSDCVALCNTRTCQYITYEYETRICWVRTANVLIYTGEPLIGFKAIPSGDIGVNAASKARGKAGASGQYSFYQDPNALDVGIQTAPSNAGGFTTIQDCMNACDNDVTCAGFTITMRVIVATRPTTCMLIRGDRTLGVFKRSMTRVDVERLAIPSLV